MGIKLSDLPPDLQQRIRSESGLPLKAPRQPRARQPRSRWMRRCACLCEIFRPDGQYPDRCDGCGQTWPE